MLGESLRDPTVEAMFGRLRGRFATWTALAGARTEEVQPLIAALPASDAKAANIIEALRTIGRRVGALRLDWLASWAVADALAWLCELPGVTAVTAAAVLNVSTLQRRVLVVDAAVLRICRRLGLCDAIDDAEACRNRVAEEAPPSWEGDELVELHVQLSRLGETYCRPAGPDCGGCPVRVDCRHAVAMRVRDRAAHAPANDTGPIADRLDDYLRRRIARIERDGVSAQTVTEAGLNLGRPIDEHFIGGVFPAGVHQCAGARMEDGAARYLLALAAFAARPRTGAEVRLLVVQEDDAIREYGQLHGPGLEAFGVDVRQAAFVRTHSGTEALEVVDEALRAQAAPFLTLELRRGSALADTAVTRRLNLQARRSGAFVFLITPDLDGTSAAMTRWRAGAQTSQAARRRVGPPAVQLDLVRNRSGQTGGWVVEWSAQQRRFGSIRRLADAAAEATPRARPLRPTG